MSLVILNFVEDDFSFFDPQLSNVALENIVPIYDVVDCYFEEINIDLMSPAGVVLEDQTSTLLLVIPVENNS